MLRRLMGFGLMLLTPLAAAGNTVIVSEDFESYTSQADFEAQWNPDLGSGRDDVTGLGNTGRLVPDPGNSNIEPPNDDPPNIQGQAVAMKSFISEYNNTANPGDPDDPAFKIAPSATESVRLGADLFDDAVGNKKLTVALRNDLFEREPTLYGVNLVELGFWNGGTFDPTDPNNAPPNDPVFDVPATDFAYRLVLVGTPGGDLVREPNWQFFPLDLALDIDDNDPDTTEPTPDGLVSAIDVGPGWHRWEATVSETEVTLTLDLFRDGVVNLTRDGSGDIEVGVGEPGVDSIVTWEIDMFESDTSDEFAFEPFTSLRFGVPSGSGGGVTEAVVDNILLELVDVGTTANADFDGSGLVAGNDFLAWQRSFEITDGTALPLDGDANGDGNVTAEDLAIFQAQYGTNPAAAIAAAAIPEPSSAALLSGIVLAWVAAERRRRLG